MIQETPQPEKGKYKVYVNTITYNQSEYIVDTFNGVAMQQTSFPFVHCVYDDCSTDGEQDVIKKWLAENCKMENAVWYDNELAEIVEVEHNTNPNLTVVVYFFKRNLYKEPKVKRTQYTPWQEACDYEALCEGDDYWIDPDKLQKQVDFLDEHPDYVYACHRFKIHNCSDDTYVISPNVFLDKHTNIEYFSFNQEYVFLRDWITKTLTCVYRTNAVDIDYLSQFDMSRDVHLVYNLLSKGKGVCFSFVGGVYNQNAGGIFGSYPPPMRLSINYIVFKEFYLKTKDKLLKDVCANLIIGSIKLNVKEVYTDSFALAIITKYLPFFIFKKIYKRIINDKNCEYNTG